MHPVYMWGCPYPSLANPTHYAANDDPRAKEISSYMKTDPTSISSPYQPWPYGGNYCYPGPQECHGGYNHGCFGGPYGFRPPYPYHPPPPSPYHSHGFYPPFPGAYPAYSIPPPHYSVEQPRYDYDKNALGSHHCCGCNHREDEKKSRIVQVEPEIEKKTKTTDSLIPYLMKDSQYPIMWVPPGFMNTESKAEEKDKHTHDRIPLEPLEPLKQGGNGETERNQKGGDDKRFPFPIFLFPSNEVGEKNDDKKRQTKINDEAESDRGIRPLVQKVIPVKQLGAEEEKNLPKSIETKAKSASVEKTDNGIEGKASPKTPKLPPVCLRVDPLPRKKNTSRSPSPPGDKTRSKESRVDESKSSQQQTQLSEGLEKSNGERNVKTIKVVKSDGVGDRCGNVSNGSETGIVCKAEKKKLPENEAALIIQSACRGFQVRKSKPISKLRQIAEVGKRVIELRNRIHDLGSCCFDNKEKLVIGETIMSLLLKLDTIQGLHPVVREVRKCVAKELVGLQEKLDSLIEQDTTKRVKDDDGISESQLDSAIKNDTDVEPQMEVRNDVNNKQPVDDKDDDEKSETQSDSNVDEQSSGELNKDQQLPEADEMEQKKVGEDNSKGQMSVDESVKPQKREEVTMNEMESDASAESGIYVEPQCREEEEATMNQVESETAAESGTYVEPQCREEVTKNQKESDTAAECEEFNAEEASEEVSKNQVEMLLSDEEVKAMEEVVKEQMEVIRELTAKVKDLEKKLLKNKNNNNKRKRKKLKKGRKSSVCVVEDLI